MRHGMGKICLFDDMEKVYHNFEKWEDWKSGFYRTIENKQRDFFRANSVSLLSNSSELFIEMKRVVCDWKFSSEENLTNLCLNRRAWLGQAACCHGYRTPEDLTREAWGLLSKEQQNQANAIADQVIKFWEKNYTTMPKHYLSKDVLTAAKERISLTFDVFNKVYVSFSGGKDSTVMLHLVMQEAIKRKRRVGVLFVDLEGQYKLTIDHIRQCYDMYAQNVDPFWCCLPIHLRNAVSVYETHWICWQKERKEIWVRELPENCISEETNKFPFFHAGMEFEEFVPEFGEWYAHGENCACFVGIRTDESLNRFRTIASQTKKTLEGLQWTTLVSPNVYNIYPIYDWRTEDLWIFQGKNPELPYNTLYDVMYKAGLTIHQMRICQPYGDDQRRGLWLFHLIEPETWAKVVARVNGANGGALYVQETGNFTGYRHIKKPEGHTWKSFANMLLNSMPPKTQIHYENKVAVFQKWWMDRGYENGIPDEADAKLEAARKVPSWRRVCKSLLRNDYWCKGLSFTQHRSEAYQKYLDLMTRRRKDWGI